MTQILRAEFDTLRAALKNKESSQWVIGNEILAIVGPKSGVGKKDGSKAKLDEIAADLAHDFPQYTTATLAKLRNTSQGFPNGIPADISWATCESASTAERLDLALSRLGNRPPLREHVRDVLKVYDTEMRETARTEAIARHEAAQAAHEAAQAAKDAADLALKNADSEEESAHAGQQAADTAKALQAAQETVKAAKRAIPRLPSKASSSGNSSISHQIDRSIKKLQNDLWFAPQLAPAAKIKVGKRLADLAIEISDMAEQLSGEAAA